MLSRTGGRSSIWTGHFQMIALFKNRFGRLWNQVGINFDLNGMLVARPPLGRPQRSATVAVLGVYLLVGYATLASGPAVALARPRTPKLRCSWKATPRHDPRKYACDHKTKHRQFLREHAGEIYYVVVALAEYLFSGLILQTIAP